MLWLCMLTIILLFCITRSPCSQTTCPLSPILWPVNGKQYFMCRCRHVNFDTYVLIMTQLKVYSIRWFLIPGTVCPQLWARRCGPARLWAAWWHLSSEQRSLPHWEQCPSHKQCVAALPVWTRWQGPPCAGSSSVPFSANVVLSCIPASHVHPHYIRILLLHYSLT